MSQVSVNKMLFWGAAWSLGLYLLTRLGLQRARDRITTIRQMVIPSISFLIWRLSQFKTTTTFQWVVWGLGVLVFFCIYSMRSVEVIGPQEVKISADYSALPVALGFFALRTFFGFYPSLLVEYTVLDQVVGGLFGAYWIGQTIAYVRKYYINSAPLMEQ